MNYENEDGIDAGGLAKDWFVEIIKALISVNNSSNGDGSAVSFSIVHETEQGVTLNPTAGVVFSDDECRYLYTTLGIFLAKAIVGKFTILFCDGG